MNATQDYSIESLRTPRNLVAIWLILLLTSCHDQVGSNPGANPGVSTPSLTLSGSLKNNQAIALPKDLTVVGCWGVGTWDPGGYNYIFGTGTIDQVANTFSISFPSAPPVDALNMGALGVANILLLQNPPQGKVTDSEFQQLKIFGAINLTCVLYKLGNAGGLTDPPGIVSIPQGYSPAIAIPPVDGIGHDTLRVIRNTGLELLIDTSFSAFHFANWS